MAIAREEFFRKLYYRLHGEGRRECICTRCGVGPTHIATGFVLSEPCDNCGAVAWRELTEEEFASETRKSDLLALHSAYLASELGSLYDENDESSQWIKEQGDQFLECLEGIGNERTAKWLTLNLKAKKEIFEFVLDEYYTRNFLKKARKVVERTMRLTAMTPKATPDRGVNLYLREATRCCIFGFWDSSVALTRATLELALKHRLKHKLGRLMPTVDDLKPLLDDARRTHLIDDAHHSMGDQVRRDGNRILHGVHASEDLAWQTLAAARGVLNYLYSRL